MFKYIRVLAIIPMGTWINFIALGPMHSHSGADELTDTHLGGWVVEVSLTAVYCFLEVLYQPTTTLHGAASVV